MRWQAENLDRQIASLSEGEKISANSSSRERHWWSNHSKFKQDSRKCSQT
jgi:hypothetical protein